MVDEVRAILDGAVFTCNGSPGWHRIAYLNTADTSQECPTGLAEITSLPVRVCGSTQEVENDTCFSTKFSTGGRKYSQVCGRIKGYQHGETGAFFYGRNNNIEQPYLDGISLTHGEVGNRQHVWSFVAGGSEDGNSESCPCDGGFFLSPSFVGEDYFCETSVVTGNTRGMFDQNDPLWDGEGCVISNNCCEFNGPPWFNKTLPASTTDDLELRVCRHFVVYGVDIPVQEIELYVK